MNGIAPDGGYRNEESGRAAASNGAPGRRGALRPDPSAVWDPWGRPERRRRRRGGTTGPELCCLNPCRPNRGCGAELREAMPMPDYDFSRLADRCWRVLEPVHATTYFADESRSAADSLGLKGWWMCYFAFRSAPLGSGAGECRPGDLLQLPPVSGRSCHSGCLGAGVRRRRARRPRRGHVVGVPPHRRRGSTRPRDRRPAARHGSSLSLRMRRPPARSSQPVASARRTTRWRRCGSGHL